MQPFALEKGRGHVELCGQFKGTKPPAQPLHGFEYGDFEGGLGQGLLAAGQGVQLMGWAGDVSHQQQRLKTKGVIVLLCHGALFAAALP
jgi:hypothetical protein